MDMRNIDLNLLVVLDALLAEQNVSRAARRLRLSQPATSAALSRLRDLLGDPLLTRQGSRMIMTTRAEELVGPVRKIIDEIDRALTSSEFEAEVCDRTFRIAATDNVVFSLFPALMRRLEKVAPAATIEIWPLDDKLYENMGKGLLDLAIAGDWYLRHIETRTVLFSEKFLCVVRKDHPRIRRSLTLNGYLKEKHALVSHRGKVRGNVDMELEKIGHARNVALTLPNFLAVPAIIARTDLIVTLAERVAGHFAKTDGLRTFKPPVEIPGFSVSLAWHARADADAPLQWLRNEIAEACRT
ncbi:MAG: LysR family transcriptional regulator [Pseudomonadota bacterium]